MSDVVAGLSAVICSRNRTAQLQRALESLFTQTLPPAEVLVIDSAPSGEATLRMVAQQFPRARYVQEPVMGLDVARNRALHEARHAIVAFLDDDAVADPGWCQAFLRVFSQSPRAGVCTGRVEAFALDTEAQRLFEANGGFSRGSERICLPDDARRPLHGRRAPLIAWAVSVGNGASFAIRREVALRLGGFDDALDLGEALPGGGDLDMFWRVVTAGYALIYEPSALAWHEHRRDMPSVVRQLAGHQRAVVTFLCKSVSRASGRRRASVFLFLLWRLLKPGVRVVKRAVGRDPLPVHALLRMWQEAGRGLWAYPAARRVGG